VPGTFRATIDLSGVDPRAGLAYVKVDVTSVDGRFIVVDFEPRGITVQLDPFINKTVPVRVNTGPTPSNLDVRDAVITPESVTVSGPESLVRLVVAAQANVVIDPKGIDIDRDVPLIPVDILGNAKTPVDVSPNAARIKIAVFSSRQTRPLAVNPVVTGTPPAGYSIDSVTVDPPVVTVEGDAAELAGLIRADTAPIAIGAATSSIEVDMPLALPPGVLAVGSDTVHVSITIRPVAGTRTFDAGTILDGGQAGLDYRLSTGNVLVTIGGPVADLQRLDGAAIAVTVNIAGLGPGNHVVTPTLTLQAGLRLLAIEPSSITVTVAPQASTPPSAAP
jgi:YbbR domain-containing protein